MTERWKAPKLDPFVEMVSLERRKFTLKNGYAPDWSDMTAMAIKLLTRQHRAFVRMVKKLDRIERVGKVNGCMVEFRSHVGEYVRLADVLAALAKQGGAHGATRKYSR